MNLLWGDSGAEHNTAMRFLEGGFWLRKTRLTGRWRCRYTLPPVLTALVELFEGPTEKSVSVLGNNAAKRDWLCRWRIPAPRDYVSIRSTHLARNVGATNGSAKYWVSRATLSPLNSMMLTV